MPKLTPEEVEAGKKPEHPKRMDAIELMHFEEMLARIGKKGENFRPVERDLVWSKMPRWEDDKLFPVYDLWRLYLLHPDSSAVFKGTDRGILLKHTMSEIMMIH